MPKNSADELFKLPISEFIAARKSLATRLKQEGRADEADRVKTLPKPSLSVWTANQLYWQHREEFDRLIAAGQRFRKAQTSGKVTEMRAALDARTAALSDLSNLATELLSDAGHNASLDTLRRLTSTLEAISAYEVLPDGAASGRLTEDIDAPGFESLAGFTARANKAPERQGSSMKAAASKVPSSKDKAPSTKYENKTAEKARQARLAIAKASLQEAKKSLSEAQARAQRLETATKKADAAAKDTEKQRRETEQALRQTQVRLKKITAAAEDARERARTLAAEFEEATKNLADSNHAVERATKELESVFRG